MNLKILFGSIIIIFVTLIFILPLSKPDSKSKQLVNEIAKKTEEIVKDDTIKKDINVSAEPKVKTFDEVFKEPFKKDTLKKVQIEEQIKTNDEQVKESFAKLDKILEEKNIKLKKVEPSENKTEEINKKIEKIKKDYEIINKL